MMESEKNTSFFQRLKSLRKSKNRKNLINHLRVYLHDLKRFPRREKITLITQPVVMISQIQRSGGTLFGQLFDGHPMVYSYPAEIAIGNPKWNWPDIDIKADPLILLAYFYNAHTDRFIIDGYSQGKEQTPSFPFNFSRKYQKETFKNLSQKHGIKTQRDALNIYFSSYFNAWIDCKLSDAKKYITGFTPRLNMHPKSVERFFRDYPDGKLITVVRDPLGWYASAMKHAKKYKDVDKALELWRISAQSSVDLASKQPDKVKLVLFSNLIENTFDTMQKISLWLEIPFNKILLTPTFLRAPIKANSSYKVDSNGINKDATKREALLDKRIKDIINSRVGPLYESILNNSNVD